MDEVGDLNKRLPENDQNQETPDDSDLLMMMVWHVISRVLLRRYSVLAH